MRQPRYQAIAEQIRALVEGDDLAPGRLLPSESELAATHDASRVTIRRALEVVRDEGLIDSRQGFGWFVAGDPVQQTLGKLATIETQLTGRGLQSERRVLDFGFTEPTDDVEAVLGPAPVLRVRRLNLADGAPFARVTVWCPESLGAALSRDDVEARSFLELLDVDVVRATQSIGAVAATADDASLLDVPVGSPLLRCERITHGTDGPVLVSEFVFPGHLTEFLVELTSPSPSIAPSGLRLVGDDT